MAARKTKAATDQGQAVGNGGGEEETTPSGVGSTRRVKGRQPKLGQVDPATEGEDRDIGERATESVADRDKVYTADSKERWGADQPTLTDQLAASRKTAEEQAKADAKR